MKKQLEDELFLALTPLIYDGRQQDAKMVITMCLGQYDVAKPETSLTVYEGDLRISRNLKSNRKRTGTKKRR